MSVLMQLLGGVFYLLQKIFLSVAERTERENPTNKKWRIWSWVVYLMGLPPWVIIFVLHRNWIAAALEASGAPSMILGLVVAIRGKGKKPKWLDYISLVAIFLGLGYSLYDFRGITTWNQVLEIGIVVGFLVGTYQLAHERPDGYLWYILMCGSNTALMHVQHYPWLVAQQIVSLVFIFDAYFAQRAKSQPETKEG